MQVYDYMIVSGTDQNILSQNVIDVIENGNDWFVNGPFHVVPVSNYMVRGEQQITNMWYQGMVRVRPDPPAPQQVVSIKQPEIIFNTRGDV